MTFSLFVKLSYTAVHHHLKALWQPHITSYWDKTSVASTHLSTEGLPVDEQPTAAGSPTLVPKQSPRPKRQHPLPDPMESMPIGGTTPKATLGGPSSPKRQEIPPWFKTLKPKCAKAFN